jgi:hypothetical protein
MSQVPSASYEYQVGGSLPVDAPTYVKRLADQELYSGIKAGHFCYVLNTRQMGKSSLRVQTMHRLRKEGIVCADIDLSIIGTTVHEDQWYASVMRSLTRSFGLSHEVDLGDWLQERSYITPPQRFNEFIESVLLNKISSQIVVFVDEIDSIQSLRFASDDFFAVIRACYNNRADKPDYHRLTFVLLGVADPSELIRDKTRTPFNIGQAIELSGFKLPGAEPLAIGLTGKADDAEALLQAVLDWTCGQPFLTQKICKLIIDSPSFIPLGEEGTYVSRLVQTHVIDNWEAQDDPEHLKTIADRILMSPGRRTARLLGIYQRLLDSGATLAADGSAEQMELRLSGLVVEQRGFLRVYNRIYATIFNEEWVNRILADLRPYSEALLAWFASNGRDDSRLLRGQALLDAQAWAVDKSLSDHDWQFLASSQTAERRDIQRQFETEKEANRMLTEASETIQLSLDKEREANQVLTEAKRKAGKKIIIGAIILTLTILLSLMAILIAMRNAERVSEYAKAAEMNSRSAKQEASEARLKTEQASQELETLTKQLEAERQKAESRLQEVLARQQTAERALEESRKVELETRARTTEAEMRAEEQRKEADRQRKMAEARLLELERQRKIAETMLLQIQQQQKSLTNEPKP